MKLFSFNDLIKCIHTQIELKINYLYHFCRILNSKAVLMYRKLPFIRILTVTYLFDGSHFTTNCSEYKYVELLLLLTYCMNITLGNFGHILMRQ